MGKKFNPNEKSKFIQYLDANNLYGWAMSLPLPVRGFKWMTDLKNWREVYDQEGRDVFLKLTWNTQRSFMIFTMNIH